MRAGVTIGLLSIVLPAAPAAAQLQGCGFSECPNNEERPTVVVENPGERGEELPNDEERPATVVETPGRPGEVEGNVPDTLVDEQPTESGSPGLQASAPRGELPFTGGDVAGLALIGVAAVGAGAVLVRRSKTAKA